VYLFNKLFLLLLLSISPILAFDNEIVINGKVVEGVTIDILTLREKRDSIYMFSNSNSGVKITVKELTKHKDSSLKNILNNGEEYPLPAVYSLFKSSSFLGAPYISLPYVVLGVGISVQ
jgi:hypothetical protein